MAGSTRRTLHAFATGIALISTSVASMAKPYSRDLAAEIDATESIRAIKRLEAAYAQFSQAGMWREMAQLFATDAKLSYGNDEVRGPEEIHAYFRDHFGEGRENLQPGTVHTDMIVGPVINLSADGRSAKGRWEIFSMTGRLGGTAEWAGGIEENEYVREGGVWKIARLRHYPVFGGPYESGWFNLQPDAKVVPYHFTAAEAGTPIPPALLAGGGKRLSDATLSTLDGRAQAMLDADQVSSLQSAYGYYVDRKMWDDVVDLFTADGTFEIAGLGVWRGKAGVRRAMERDGPAGLRTGELNDHVIFDTIVEVAPSGTEASVRGLGMTQFGDVTTGRASIGVAVFENRFVKQGGKWRISAVHSFPQFETDYYQGWAKSMLPLSPPDAAHAPDTAAHVKPVPGTAFSEPGFPYRHPVTGAVLQAPSGESSVATMRLTGPPNRRGSGASPRLIEVERKVAVARAYDGVENIASAFGYWIDDFAWDRSSALFTGDGRRGKYMVGFYVGPDHIRRAETIQLGLTPTPRTSMDIHYRMQPVISIAPDGRSAKLRTRLFHLHSNAPGLAAGTFASGMYPNDAAVLDNGVWKFSNVAIDEPYFASRNYKLGWARGQTAPPPASQGGPAKLPALMQKLVDALPPDVPIGSMPIRQQGFVPGAIISWPQIKPMWFHYPNPVSGRLPPYYCPDERTCEERLRRSK